MESSAAVRSSDAASSSDARGATGSSSGHNFPFANWLYRSHAASVLWLVVRVWLGYQWLNAGYQKIWGAERSAFWFGSGAGVKGFAAAGVAGSAGVNPGYASLAVLLVLAWRNAGWIGLDRFVLNGAWRRHRCSAAAAGVTHRPDPVVPSTS